MHPAPGDSRYRELDDKIMQAIQESPLTSEEITARAGSNDKTVRKRLKILPVIRIPDKRRILYSPASRTPPGPGDGNAPGGLTVTTSSKTPDPDNAEPPRTHAGPGPEIPTSSKKGDTKGDTKGTPKNERKGLSLSACIVSVLKAEPDYPFTVLDVVDRSGGKPGSVKRILVRLSSAGKGAGPVRKIGRGIYQYDTAKEGGSFTDFISSASPKIENLVFTKSVPLGVYPTPVSLSGSPKFCPKGTPSDPCVPAPHLGYPKTTPTGQQIAWEDYQNGTQVIRISANGAPPISPDTALLLLEDLKRSGMDDTWTCTSLELNIDSRKHRIDSSYSVQLIEGALLKAYQHGYNARVELADRRSTPAREIWDLFLRMDGKVDGKEALRRVTALEARVAQNEKYTRTLYNVVDRERDSRIEASHTAKETIPSPFTTGAAIKQEQARAATRGEPVS
jgi:hypothetical protein